MKPSTLPSGWLRAETGTEGLILQIWRANMDIVRRQHSLLQKVEWDLDGEELARAGRSYAPCTLSEVNVLPGLKNES